VAWWWRSRFHTVLSASMDALAAGAGTQVVHPFMDPSVVGAVTAHFGARGPVDRSAAMRELFGDVLPDPVLTRRSKAWFDEAFVSDESRRFAAGWTGTGVDTSLVDPERLAASWRAERPDPRSLLLMQAAWLAGR
jgi:asparagine synthase (glutamine-hydrolysing)